MRIGDCYAYSRSVPASGRLPFLVSLAVTLTIATALAAHSAEAQESHEGETAEATPDAPYKGRIILTIGGAIYGVDPKQEKRTASLRQEEPRSSRRMVAH